MVRSAAGLLFGMTAATLPAMGWAQRLDFNSGVRLSAVASTNPDLAPRGQEQSDAWLVLSPFFSVTGRLGDKATLSASFDLGASLRLSAREGFEYTSSSAIRPSGSLATTFEVVDNFFYVDVRAGIQSTLNDPFAATTDPISPVNTTTSYQVGITPYIRGTLVPGVEFEARSANSWTDRAWGEETANYRGQYAGTHSVRLDRAPRPLGWSLTYQQQTLSSRVEGQGLLRTETARASLRYALTGSVLVGARVGAERYNYLIGARDWQTFYGLEAGWRPSERTSFDGYWEDRVFGNSWQLTATHRRPRFALSAASSRQISNTPQQFLTFPGLASLVSLIDAAFTTRIPDPIERQRAVVDFLSRTRLPEELLTPTIIYAEGFTIQELNTATMVVYGTRQSLALTVNQGVTEYSSGLVPGQPFENKTKQRGAELVFNRQLARDASATASASWRETENARDASQRTRQTQLRLEASRALTRRADATLGARYQWISSTVRNDANEAALYATVSYRFD